MKWWKGLLGLDRDGAPAEAKSVDFSGVASRHDGINFRTNQVTLAQYDDAMAATNSNAAGLSATWACRNVICGSISTMPCMVYRTVGGVREIARDHSLYYVLHDSPNADQSAPDFWEYETTGIEFQGNAYADIDRRGDGSVLALHPVRPDAVTVKRDDRSGLLKYEWREGSRLVQREAADVLHLRGPMGNPLGGVSTLAMCRRAFSSALAAEQAARSTFANGLRPSGTLSMKDKLDAEQRATLEEALDRKFMGAINAGRPMVLDNELKWESINITPEDAQMLESRKFSGEEICRIFGVPPAMVGYGDSASNWGTGKEVDVLGFLKFTLRPRIKRIEAALMKQLLTTKDRTDGVTIEFNMEGLLRADSLGRAQVNDIRLRNKSLTINEVRAQDNQPPVPWGDRPWGQIQDTQLNEDGTVPAVEPGQENQ